MRAIGQVEFGEARVLHELELPMPTPGPGEVRVRVHAACVNPTDLLNRSGLNRTWTEGRPPPWVPGIDFFGVVEALGSDPDGRLAVGDKVVGMKMPSMGEDGSYAEYVVADSASVVTAPQGVDGFAASTVLMNSLTARMSLDILAMAPGQTLAVTGAAGTLGGYVIQLARHDGLRVLADCAPKDEELVRAMGADILVPRGAGIADRFRQESPEGVDGLIDGSCQFGELVGAVKPGGHMIVTRRWSPPPDLPLDVTMVIAYQRVRDTKALEEIVRLVNQRVITTHVAEVFPAARAADAHRKQEAGGVRGRLVLDFR